MMPPIAKRARVQYVSLVQAAPNSKTQTERCCYVRDAEGCTETNEIYRVVQQQLLTRSQKATE